MATAAQLATNFGIKVRNGPNRTGQVNPQGSQRLSLVELSELQRKLHAKGMEEGITIAQLRDCALAWQRLESQRLDTSGTPRPAQFRTDLKPANKAKSIPSWEEPKQVQDAVVVASPAPVVSKDVPPSAVSPDHKPESH